MRERTEQALRLACLVLGALLLFQIGRIVIHRNPVAHLQIPPLPTLAETDNKGDHTNGPAAQTHPGPAGAHPQASHTAQGSNAPAGPVATKSVTNSAGETVSGKSGTNAPIGEAEAKTEQASASDAGKPAQGPVTGEHIEAGILTNLEVTAQHASPAETNHLATHSSSNVVASKISSNSIPTAGARSSTNSNSHLLNGPPPGMMAGMHGGPGGPGMRPGMPVKLPQVPPDILARVDRVTDSEILGPVMHPLPMALLGIAGNVAFLRAPTGQTGLVKEGDKLGELKLLKIGINRVLVEDEGQKKELMIFSGLGGDSLLPNEPKSTP